MLWILNIHFVISSYREYINLSSFSIMSRSSIINLLIFFTREIEYKGVITHTDLKLLSTRNKLDVALN